MTRDNIAQLSHLTCPPWRRTYPYQEAEPALPPPESSGGYNTCKKANKICSSMIRVATVGINIPQQKSRCRKQCSKCIIIQCFAGLAATVNSTNHPEFNRNSLLYIYHFSTLATVGIDDTAVATTSLIDDIMTIAIIINDMTSTT